MASIPSDIIFNILSQLPVKSLARFKTLNKPCRSIITDPQFIRTHFKNGANKANDNLCLILSCEEHQHPNGIIHFLTFRDNNEPAVFEYSALVNLGSYKVLPSCNGLVCFHGFHVHGGVHVCNNPSTKDIVRLPDIHAEGFLSLGYGFGFDEMKGKHKVIQFLAPLKAKTSVDSLSLRIEIFTLGDNSWRTKLYHSCSGTHEPPVFAGGFFYWIKVPSVSSLLIVSFDIAKEIFEDISPPEGIRISINNPFRRYLVGLRGELCLVRLDSVGNRMDIWILKRNVAEKKKNWVLAAVVHQSETLVFTRPVAFNGKEVLLHGFISGLSNLHSYNLQTGSFRQLEVKGAPKRYFDASHHMESLFPVKPVQHNPCDSI